MKKAVSIGSALLAVMVGIAGCGSTANSNTVSKSGSTEGNSKPVTITMLTHWDAQTAKQFQPYIKEYEKEHPNIKIDLETVQFADLLKKIGVDELSNNGPDIYHIYSLWLPDLAANGAVQPAPSGISSDVKQNYGQNFATSVSYGGKLYGYPTEVDDYALIYNKKLFREAGISGAPKTWSQLEKDAKKLTKIKNGKIMQQGFGTITGWDSGVVHPFVSLLLSDGGQFIDNGQADLDSPQAHQTLNLYKQLIDQKSLDPQMSTGTGSTPQYQSNFELGHTGMIIMADWWESTLQSGMGDSFKDVGTAPIPVGPSGKQSESVFYTWMYTVNAHSPHAKQAWAFLKWLNSPEATGKSSRMGDWLMAQGIMPSRKSDIAAHQKQLGNPFMKTFVDELGTAQTFPIVKGGAKITTDLQKQIESVVFGQSSVNQALSTAQSQVNKDLQGN